MPDTRASLDDFVEWLFEDPIRRARVRGNPAYRELGDSLAGVHELVTIGLLQNEADSGNYDEIILDTAPSRHALAFLTYPSRLLGLLEARALNWLAALAQSADPAVLETQPKAGLFRWGRAKVESVFGSIVGIEGMRNLSALFADMVAVRERWAALARRTNQLFQSATTRYLIIGSPSGGAIADVAYLLSNLKRHALHPSAIVLNRAEQDAPECELTLLEALSKSAFGMNAGQHAALLGVLHTLASDHQARAIAAHRAAEELKGLVPDQTSLVRLPYVHRSEPSAIVLALADAWDQTPLR
jgi:anion-transporting  ArsA/GET3 family ATPase